MDLRLRLSLVARMVVATAVLSSLSVVLALLVAAVGAYLGYLAFGLVVAPLRWSLDAPRLAAVLSVHPAVLALLAVGYLYGVVRFWSRIEPHVRAPQLIPPAGPTSWGLVLVGLVALYEALVEAGATLALLVLPHVADLRVLAALLVLFAVLALVTVGTGLRSEVRALRERTVGDADVVDDPADRLTGTVGRLARLADVPAPTVRVVERARPEAFTVGSRRNAVVVVSTGLIDCLPDDELEAVLAHEVSHLANGDSRLMAAALAPVVFAEDLADDSPSDFRDRFWWAVSVALLRYGQFGAGVLSRGREWAADAGAAALTGSPSSLASALARLDDRRGAPRRDARDWSEALAALDVLPALDPGEDRWTFRTHPPTAARIERLQRLAGKMERR